MAYDVCLYAPQFRDQILELQRHLWSPDRSLNDRQFAWKYERNPYRAEPLIAVALEAGRVVGMLGAYGTDWRVGRSGDKLGALCLGDTVIERAHQLKGLLQAMHEALFDVARASGASFILNTSSGFATREAALRSGWKGTEEIRPVALCVPPVTASTPRPSVWQRLGLARRGAGGASFAIFDRRARRLGSRISVARGPRPRAMAELIERTAARASIRQSHDAGYFGWRFGSPLCDYRFVYRDSDADRKAIDGYLVVQSHGPRHDTGFNLVDWEVDSPATLSVLLAALRTGLGPDGVTTWPSADDAVLSRVFLGAGFCPVDPPRLPWVLPRLLILPLAGTANDQSWHTGGLDLLRLESWHLRMTASDFY